MGPAAQPGADETTCSVFHLFTTPYARHRTKVHTAQGVHHACDREKRQGCAHWRVGLCQGNPAPVGALEWGGARCLQVSEMLEQWIMLQRAWMYLEPIFSSPGLWWHELSTCYARMALAQGMHTHASNAPTARRSQEAVVQQLSTPLLPLRSAAPQTLLSSCPSRPSALLRWTACGGRRWMWRRGLRSCSRCVADMLRGREVAAGTSLSDVTRQPAALKQRPSLLAELSLPLRTFSAAPAPSSWRSLSRATSCWNRCRRGSLTT